MLQNSLIIYKESVNFIFDSKITYLCFNCIHTNIVNTKFLSSNNQIFIQTENMFYVIDKKYKNDFVVLIILNNFILRLYE